MSATILAFFIAFLWHGGTDAYQFKRPHSHGVSG